METRRDDLGSWLNRKLPVAVLVWLYRPSAVRDLGGGDGGVRASTLA